MLCELCFLSLFFNVIKALQQIPHAEEITNDLRIFNCAKAIGKMHFLQTQNVEIISQERIYRFENFGTVIRTTPEFRYPDFRASRTKYAIIFLEGTNYQEDLQLLNTLRGTDPQGRFIVAIKNEINLSNLREEYATKIIFHLANVERWNVVILMNDAGNGMIRVYTYVMYTSGNCNRTPKLVDHGSCHDAVTLSNLFPAFVNFYKCPIHLSTKDIPPFSIIYEENGEKHIRGSESNMVELIVEKLNATYEVLQMDNGAAVRNSVETRKVDMAWCCLLQYESPGMVWSQSFIINRVLIVIPQSRLMPRWMNLILPFQIEIWATLGTLISVHVLIKVIAPSIRKEFPLEWMLSGFFGIGILKQPSRLPHRLYVLSWVLFGYVIMQSYSASLTGFFASPGQYKEMQTLDELDKSNIIAGGLKNMKSQLAETNPRLSRDFKVLSEAEYFKNLEKLATGAGGMASYIQADRLQNITKGQESEFIVIREHINVYPVALLLPDFSPILERCNQVILRICDSGLNKFWQKYFIRAMNSGIKPREDNTTRRTSFIHLEAALFILCVGYCLSSIIFAVEFILVKIRK